VLLALVAGFRIPALPWWGLAAAGVVMMTIAWRLSGCRHTGPLGLLPATTDFQGTRLPPRWFCDACGKTWTAHFEYESAPIPRFRGYDASKAVRSAKRAADLAERQRALAIQRAGLRPAPKKARALREAVPSVEPADVVPIGQGRRLIG
jgi:hypothetical protein